MKRRDLATLFVIAAIWGASYIFIRILVPALGPWGMVGARMVISALVLYGVMRALGQGWGEWRLWRHYLMVAFWASFVAQSMIGYAALTLNAATLAILNATAAMFAAALSWCFMGDVLSWRRGVGLVIGIAGVAMVVGFDPVPMDARVAFAFAAALGAACCYAISSIYASSRLGTRPALELALTQSLFAGLLSMPFAVPALVSAVWTPKVWLALIALSVVCTAFANVLFYGLMKRTDPTVSLSVTYLVPCFGMLWGWLFLDETVAVLQMAGFGVIVASLFMVASHSRSKPAAARL